MTLDEPRNHKHAEQIERGTMSDREKRQDEAQRLTALADLLRGHDLNMSDHWWNKLAGRVAAYGPRVCDLLGKPILPPVHRDLRQQQTAETDDVEFWEEHVHHLKREYEDACAVLARVKAAQPRELVDRDEVNADADDARLSQERADERKAANAPRVA